jgi:hypothetical protein
VNDSRADDSVKWIFVLLSGVFGGRREKASYQSYKGMLTNLEDSPSLLGGAVLPNRGNLENPLIVFREFVGVVFLKDLGLNDG